MMDFAGLILAGGEGKRWGGPKAWAKLPNGRTFLESCAEVLREAGSRPMVATVPPGTDCTAIGALSLVALAGPGLDMFASLVTGLDRLIEDPDWQVVAVLPVDHPLVSPGTVTALVDATTRAAIPTFNGKHGHPVCLARSVVQTIVEGKLTGPTLRQVMRSVDAVDVPVDDPGVITNCNTPEALATALKNLRYDS
jgi:CTP:molybdopterin cytidylyltransferase MocA